MFLHQSFQFFHTAGVENNKFSRRKFYFKDPEMYFTHTCSIMSTGNELLVHEMVCISATHAKKTKFRAEIIHRRKEYDITMSECPN